MINNTDARKHMKIRTYNKIACIVVTCKIPAVYELPTPLSPAIHLQKGHNLSIINTQTTFSSCPPLHTNHFE